MTRPTPGEQDTELGNVINVTGLVHQAGRLTWHPPSAGTWEILRIGYTDSDTRVSTSSDHLAGAGHRLPGSRRVRHLLGSHRCALAGSVPALPEDDPGAPGD